MEKVQELQRALKDKKATRREFMMAASAMAIGAATASAMWSGRALAAKPRKGGHLTAGLADSNTSDSLDPATYYTVAMICLSRSFHDNLVDVGQDNSAVPALAESWEASADAKTWRFKLRKGVEFSNGKSLTTEDVIDSINVHHGPDTKSVAAGVFSGITDVKADGSDTVVITLEDGNADFPFLLTDYHMCVVPSLGEGKADVLSPVGTGLYTIKHFDPGVLFELERNPNAWQQNQFGHFDSAEAITINDDNSRQTALLGQSVSAINRPPLKTAKLLKQKSGISIQSVDANYHFSHPMSLNVAPFDSNDFRLALKYALPRQDFIQKILFGYGTIGYDHPIGPGFRFHDPSIVNEHDLDKAKFHLKKSGHEGAKIQIHAADVAYSGAVDAAALFQNEFNKIGLDMKIVREANDGYWTEIWNKVPFLCSYWGSRPVEDMILSLAYLSDAPWNVTKVKDPHLDGLIKAARGELDQAKRQAMYSEVQVLIAKEGGELIPAFGQYVSATDDTIGVPDQIGGGWEMDGGHFIKRWWKKA